MTSSTTTVRRHGGRLRGEAGGVRLVVPAVTALVAVAFMASGQTVPFAGGEPQRRGDGGVGSPEAFGKLPMSFEVNKGQTAKGVDFLARGRGYSVFLTPTGPVTSLTKAVPSARPATGDQMAEPDTTVVRMHLVGGNRNATPRAQAKLPGVVNHLIGSDRSKWITGISTYGKVAYEGVYPGVDLVYHGGQAGLEYDFVVEPGISPRTIALAFEGAHGMRIADDGALVLATPAGELRQSKPVLYQQVGGRRVPVAGSFVLRPGNQVGFEVGAYDTSRTLVIDPVLEYSTFLGGTANDFGWGIAVDGDGNAYLGGETSSPVFPRGGGCATTCTDPTPRGATPGAFQTTKGAGADAFVLKMDPTGSALVYATYLGGSGNDSGQDLAIDASGNAYLIGSTNSGNDNPATAAAEVPFPITAANAYDTTCGTDGFCNGAADHFVTKLDSSGASLLYSTYLGGKRAEWHAPGTPYSGAAGLAVRGTVAYIHSSTYSGNFPVTATAFQNKCASCAAGDADGYVALVDTADSGAASLRYSSFIGGNGEEQSKDLAVDSKGRVYLTGITVSTALDGNGVPTGANSFPTKSAMQPTYQGGYSDAYVAKVNPFRTTASQTLAYSTFLGGGGLEEGWGIAVRDKDENGATIAGRAYVTGYTTSGPDPNPAVPNDPATDPLPYFPTTAGAYDPTYNGRASTDSGSTLFLDGDAFVTVLNGSGTGTLWSTFVGGPSADYGQDIALDSAGQVYITGWTTCRMQDNRATVGVNEAPPQFEDPPDSNVSTGRNPGEPDVTGVGDCDGANPYGTNTVPAGVFPQVNPIVDVTRGLDESVMDPTYLGFELHNSPTGLFVTNLTADGAAVDYSVLLDGPGFDRGFAIAVRDADAGGNPITPEVFVSGRTGRQGFPVVAGTAPGAILYDGTYNGAGRDTLISKLVG